jgi:Nucleotidyltransferase of unknown function (DUF6036)
MPQHDLVPQPWRAFLMELDGLLTEPVELHCLGGFVVTMHYGLIRSTGDIDIVQIAPRGTRKTIIDVAKQGGELHQKHKVYLDHVTVAEVPMDYESRLTQMFPGQFNNLRLMALDPYDLALTKLQRNGERDRSDVRFLARTIPFDLKILEKRYQTELRPTLSNPERENSTMQLWKEMIEEDRAT